MGIALYPDAVGVELIRTFASGLADVADETSASTPVATCGDWLLHDLVWHLTEVEDFWRFVVDHRPDGPDDYVEPDRPDDDALPGRLRAAADSLATALAGGDPDDEAWSWSDDHTLGFTIRRQTHEALVHYIDGVLAAGRPLPAVDPLLAADGVDELVNVMLCGVPTWAEVHSDQRRRRVARHRHRRLLDLGVRPHDRDLDPHRQDLRPRRDGCRRWRAPRCRDRRTCTRAEPVDVGPAKHETRSTSRVTAISPSSCVRF